MSVSAELLSLLCLLFFYMCHKMCEKLYSKVYYSIFLKGSTWFIMKNEAPITRDLIIFLSGCIKKEMNEAWFTFKHFIISSAVPLWARLSCVYSILFCNKTGFCRRASGNAVVCHGCDITDASLEASVLWWWRNNLPSSAVLASGRYEFYLQETKCLKPKNGVRWI